VNVHAQVKQIIFATIYAFMHCCQLVSQLHVLYVPLGMYYVGLQLHPQTRFEEARVETGYKKLPINSNPISVG